MSEGMNSGWQDDRLMQAYDLVYSVMKTWPSNRDLAGYCDSAMDAIEGADTSLENPNV